MACRDGVVLGERLARDARGVFCKILFHHRQRCLGADTLGSLSLFDNVGVAWNLVMV